MTLDDRRIKLWLQRGEIIRRIERKSRERQSTAKELAELSALTTKQIKLELRIERQERKAA